jgi:ADP-ribose pyrophosphatase
MLTPWKRLTTKVLQKNPWWEYRYDTCIMPNGKEGEYHYMHSLRSVAVVPVTDEGKIPLVRQYRYLFEKEMIDLPMGHVEEGQSALEAAHKELAEEVCFSAGKMEDVISFEPFVGKADDVCTVFVASQLRPVDSSCDESEEFEHLEVFPHELDEMIATGKITDGMTIAAWTLAKPRVLQIINEKNSL